MASICYCIVSPIWISPANFTWTFLGNTFYALTQWGILAALAKLGSAEMVGSFSLALALASPILMLASM